MISWSVLYRVRISVFHHDGAGDDNEGSTQSSGIVTDDSSSNVGGGDDDYEALDSFEDMGLPEELLRGVFSYGFEKPSAIQQKAIRPTMQGRDLIAQAQSGTGKTGTFAIGTLATIDPKLRSIQSIILSPTRELAKQNRDVTAALGDHMDGLQVRACVGGRHVLVREECRILQRGGIQVISGTPGRILDLIQRRALRLDGLRQVFLDEAEEMLSLGFRDQIYEIFQYLPDSVQVCLLRFRMRGLSLSLLLKAGERGTPCCYRPCMLGQSRGRCYSDFSERLLLVPILLLLLLILRARCRSRARDFWLHLYHY